MGLSRGLIFSAFTFFLTCFPSISAASDSQAPGSPLPHVSSKMKTPGFWIKKLKDPSRLLFNSGEIQRLNEENLKKQDLLLCRVKNLKEEWTREEILALQKEDWEGFGDTGTAQYGRDGNPLDDRFWEELKKNWNQDGLKEREPMRFGLILEGTDLRVFPTDAPSYSNPANQDFDRFQHSSVSPGSLVGIYGVSRDRKWAYVQTRFIRGWVRRDALAVASRKSEPVDYEEAEDRLVVTGSSIAVYSDPFLRQKAFTAPMAASFPFLNSPGGSGMKDQVYLIKVPIRGTGGTLQFGSGYIPKTGDVHRGFLPYHQQNVAKQAFKMLHQPYGWGETSGGRDCSRFIMDLFETFGILLPRNSMLQARIGIDLDPAQGKTVREKKRALDQAIPLATTLRLPGHIMLYLGKHHGRYYVIHSIWGIQKGGRSGTLLQKIGRVAVSDLSLGESGPNGSLLERITDIRFIGKAHRSP